VNKGYDSGILFELKEFLLQCGQSIPPFLQVLKNPEGEKFACNFCGSNEHTIKYCLKFERKKLKTLAGTESPGS